MKEYHKIQTVLKRDPKTNFKTLLDGQYSLLEFEYLSNNEWVFTEKVDGTNIRVMFSNDGIRFGGKTDRADIPAMLVNALTGMFEYDRLIEIFGLEENTAVCLYGEGYGAKIQKGGGNYRKDQGFVLFDVKVGEWWLQRKDVEDIATKLNLDIVPVIGTGTLPEMIKMARGGFNSQWGEFQAEGIVARPKVEIRIRNGHRLITKIKCKDFKG